MAKEGWNGARFRVFIIIIVIIIMMMIFFFSLAPLKNIARRRHKRAHAHLRDVLITHKRRRLIKEGIKANARRERERKGGAAVGGGGCGNLAKRK